MSTLNLFPGGQRKVVLDSAKGEEEEEDRRVLFLALKSSHRWRIVQSDASST